MPSSHNINRSRGTETAAPDISFFKLYRFNQAADPSPPFLLQDIINYITEGTNNKTEIICEVERPNKNPLYPSSLKNSSINL